MAKKNQFGRFIRSKRMELALTLEEVGKKIGYSFAYVRDVEAGRRRPFKKETFPALAETLECDVKTLEKLNVLDRGIVELPVDSSVGPIAMALFERRDNLSDSELERLMRILTGLD